MQYVYRSFNSSLKFPVVRSNVQLGTVGYINCPSLSVFLLFSFLNAPFIRSNFGILDIYHLFFQRFSTRPLPRQALRFLGKRLIDISPVFTLYFLECVQTALSSADIFHWFSRGWGQLSFLPDPYVAPIDLPVMAGLIAMIVQLYFTWRIWV